MDSGPVLNQRKEAATRRSWSKLDFEGTFVRIPWRASFSDTQFALISMGAIPEEMEDRWFCFFEDPDLFIHRSWSGRCIYKVRFARVGNEHVVDEAQVRESGETPELSVEFLDFLVHRLLLGEPRPWPPVPGSPLDLARKANDARQATRRPEKWAWLRRWIRNWSRNKT
jgi:hypothetical protein